MNQPINQALQALHQAALMISGEHKVDAVLQTILDAARQLVGAKYAALGVANAAGTLDVFVTSGMTAAEIAKLPHLPRGFGLLGAIIKEKRPIRLANIQEDARSVGFPTHHPPMSSFLGVPILADGKSLGNLYLTEKIEGDEFSAADQELVEMLAAHAAVAIKNARLYEQLEQLAVVEERTRIGMDLHDGVIQSIYAVGLTLDSAKMVLPEGSDEALALLDVAAEGLNGAIRDIRNFIWDLRPRRFTGNLADSVRGLVREFQANAMTPVQLTLSEGLERLPPALAKSLFLTTQEALANVARHANATAVELSIELDWQKVALHISDNGRGFNAAENMHHVGHGLSNMPTRTQKLGGSFQLHSEPGAGTQISIVVPL